MTTDTLLDAIGMIDDKYIFSAEENVIHYDDNKGISRKRPLRKALIFIAAAVIFLLGSFAIAMAVSEGFRETVFSFFFVSASEIVPAYTPDAQIDEPGEGFGEIDIDGVVHAKYIWMSDWSSAKNGMFTCSTDEIIYNRGSRFDLYAEKDGALIPVETQSVNMDYEWKNRSYHMEFEWGSYGDSLSFAYVFDNGDNGWYFTFIPDANDKVIVNFLQSIPSEGQDYPSQSAYPMIFDLENGVIIDILEGCGVDKLPDITNTAISDDYTKALLAQYDGTLYYCDINAKRLYNVNELSGERTDACSIIGDALACWALDKSGNYDCWNISLTTFERTEIFSGLPAYDEINGSGLVFISGFDIMHHEGYVYCGSGFALEVTQDKSVYVIDLLSGGHTLIDGLVWPDTSDSYIECVISPTGTRLLLSERSRNSNGYGQIGVLDYASKSYVLLSRENFNMNEHAIYWFDSDRVIIATDISGTVSRAYYVYTFISPQ